MKQTKFIAYGKLPKKQKRALDRAGRGTWGDINPVTRRPDNPKAYDRQRETRRWKADEHGPRGGRFISRAS